jgi:hypothetical protein
MPNWVSTQVSIRGQHNELARFRDGINSSNSIMESYIPTPQELRDTMSGFTHDEEKMKELAIKQEENIAKYGHKDWYEWQYATWGTKWGDCDTYLEPVNGNELCGFFQTAWGPASEGFRTISKMFPTLMFGFIYDEEGGYFAGIEAIKNGATVFEEMFVPADYAEEVDWDDSESIYKYEEWKDKQLEAIQCLYDDFLRGR